MNPGYLSWILLFSAFILCASGWKEVLLGRVSNLVMLLFFASWIIGTRLQISVIDQITVGLVYVPLFLLACHALMRTMPDQRVPVMAYALFLGAIECFLEHLLQSDPVLMSYEPYLNTNAASIVLIAAFTRHPIQQLGVLSLALMNAEWIGSFVLSGGHSKTLGGVSFQDHWWAQSLGVRAFSVIAGAFLMGLRQWIRTWKAGAEDEKGDGT